MCSMYLKFQTSRMVRRIFAQLEIDNLLAKDLLINITKLDLRL